MFNSIVQGFLGIWGPSGVTSTTVDDAEDADFTSATTEEMPSDLVDTEWPLLGQHLQALRQLSEEYDDPYLLYRVPITSQFELDKFVRRLQTHWPHSVQSHWQSSVQGACARLTQGQRSSMMLPACYSSVQKTAADWPEAPRISSIASFIRPMRGASCCPMHC